MSLTTCAALGATITGCAWPGRPGANTSPPSPARKPRIGYLYSGSRDEGLGQDDPGANLLSGLHELGYVDGENLTIEYRFAERQDDQLPALVAELVNLPVELIVLGDTRPVPVALKATQTVPLVMMFSVDPIGLGLVQSQAHPGGNLTGLIAPNVPLAGKRVELLRQAVPNLHTLAVLHNWRKAMTTPEWNDIQAAAAMMSLEVAELRVESVSDLDQLMHSPLPAPAEALYLVPDVLFLAKVAEVVEWVNGLGLPAIYGARPFVEAGGLMGYFPARGAMYRRAAYYVDRILKGTPPAELPLERVDRFEFIVNSSTARALGISLSSTTLAQITGLVE